MAARTVVFICTVILIISIFIKDVSAGTFAIDYDNDTFVKDGKPFRYISGSIHYSRVPAQYWDDRLHKIAAAGLNAIQTYIPWNFHEAEEGQYDFSDQRDVVTFLQIAQKYNLSVILRSGPYICGEWEFGGLPAWLLRQPGLKVRTMDPKFIKPVDTWMTKLYTTLKPLLYKNGGPIITVQIENEYGSYPACDYNYLRFLRDKARTMLGSDVVLFTTDGDGDGYLKCGTLPDVYATVDFGITYTPAKNFAIQRHKEPKGPLVNSEFYTGWLDHWGEKHSTTATAAVAKSLDLMLALGANVNMYMFEGGTNFEFWNGAEFPSYKAIPTSYDYDAPLSEAGDITDKYMKVRQVIAKPVPTSYDYDAPMTEAGDVTQKFMTLRSVIRKYNPVTMDVPPSTLKKAFGKVPMRFASTLVDHMDNSAVIPLSSVYPLTFEQLGHYYGFVVYKHVFRMAATGNLDLSGVRDRAYLTLIHNAEVSVNAVIERDNGNMTVPVSVSTGDYVLIIVENQGRINYGNHMNDNVKGLTTNVTLNNKPLEVWEQTGFSYNASQQVLFPTKTSVIKGYSMPSFYAGILVVDEPQDTYFDMSQWTKGQLYINSHNLGRYWPKKGPQVRLYVPKCYLSRGENSILMIELEQAPCLNISTCYVEFMDKPLINGTVDGAEDSSEKQADTFLARMIWLLLDLLYSGWEWLI